MLCSFEKQMFPRNDEESPNGFYIMKYICNTHLRDDPLAVDEDGTDLFGTVFAAKGMYLPRSRAHQFELKGHWERNQKMSGMTFVVESYEEILKKDINSIIDFLYSCCKGKRVGLKTIKKICEVFKEDTIDVIEKEPHRLCEISGISKGKYETIISCYNASKSAKEVIMFLTPLGISMNDARKVYERYKDEAINIVTQHPYKLCHNVKGMTFQKADTIAEKNGLSPYSSERIEAAIIDVLYQAEYGGDQFRITTGHLCVEYGELIQKTSNMLNGMDTNLVIQAYSELAKRKEVVARKNPYSQKNAYYIFRKMVDDTENELAKAIANIAKNKTRSAINYDEEIRMMELQEKVSLAPEQKNAVKIGLQNQFAVITGGPGTGKTTIIKFIRNIYMKNNRDKKILMCSPTGVAATRMSESTNGEACTVHKALELVANEDGYYDDSAVKELDYDLIIVDETSMLDIYLAKVLCKSVQNGAKLLFIGDVDQLPSVGPGAVLRDIIESGSVPVAVLTKVYRQADGSLIALNALLIKNGKYSFDYGEAFQFIPANDFSEAAKIMSDIYLKEVAVNGIQNVMMLSPFRQRTETGVRSLNLLRDSVNPPADNKAEINTDGRIFREGDKVIQLKNVDNIANGDVGIITKIGTERAVEFTDDGEPSEKVKELITIDFGHDRIVKYEKDDMKLVDWSYAMTVHKSQGSEANTVIFNIMDGHGIMLKRNLLYTAITRAKKKVYIIGTMSAIQKAVQSGVSDEDRRCTLLAARIKNIMETA